MRRHRLQIYIPIFIREANNSQTHFYGYYYMFILYLFLNKPAHGGVYSIQNYVIQFVSDMRHVYGFLRVLQFPPPIKLPAAI